jgi:hypothetical protein
MDVAIFVTESGNLISLSQTLTKMEIILSRVTQLPHTLLYVNTLCTTTAATIKSPLHVVNTKSRCASPNAS